LAGSIILDHNELRSLYTFIRRKAISTIIAHTAAADCLTLSHIARLNNFDVVALALVAFHAAS
jgi:hypothetical protein